MGRLIGYVRVSTEEQNLARQLEVMGDVDVLYQDKMSGKNVHREGLQKMFSEVREGDTIRVKSIDRLARSTRDLLSILDDMENRGVKVEFIDTPYLNTSSKEGRFFVTILGALAEMERITIKERQAEGIAIAKAAGKYDQTPKLTVEQATEIRRMFDEGERVADIAREFGASRITIYSILKGEGGYGKGEYADIPMPTREFAKKNPEALSVDTVAELRRRYSNGELQKDLANELGVSEFAVLNAIHGRYCYGKGDYAEIGNIKTGRLALSVEQVVEIRRKYTDGETTKNLASEYNVSSDTIKKAIHGQGQYGLGEYSDIPVVEVGFVRRGQSRKLNVEQVVEARRRYENGDPIEKLAYKFDVSVYTMSKAVHGWGTYGKGEFEHIPAIVSQGRGRKGKATVEQVREIRERVADGETQKALCEEFDINCETMRKIVKGLGAYGKGEFADIPPVTRSRKSA